MKTFMQKKENIERNWYVIDAEGKTLGRVATKAAHVLRGKHKVTYTPYVDCGDYVIIVNADKVVLTGNKLEDKKYYNHSGFPGGLRERNAKEMIENIQKKWLKELLKECFLTTDLEELWVKNYLFIVMQIISMKLKSLRL